MAICDACGRKTAFMGKQAMKNRQRVEQRVEALRHVDAELRDQLEGTEENEHPEVRKFYGNIERMSASGNRYAENLHYVSHDMGYPGVDYGEIQLWMTTVDRILMELVA